MTKKAVQKYTKKECTHHWIIEPASGGDSNGKCKKCKIVKQFSNSGWDDSQTTWGHKMSNETIKGSTI